MTITGFNCSLFTEKLLVFFFFLGVGLDGGGQSNTDSGNAAGLRRQRSPCRFVGERLVGSGIAWISVKRRMAQGRGETVEFAAEGVVVKVVGDDEAEPVVRLAVASVIAEAAGIVVAERFSCNGTGVGVDRERAQC